MTPAATAERDLRSFVLAAVAAWLAFTIKHVIVGGRPITVASNLAVVAVITLLLLIHRAKPSTWPLLLHGTAALCTLGLVLTAWITGGSSALTWWYLTALPLLVMHVGGRTAGVAWWAICCVAAVLAAWNPFDLPAEFIPTTADRIFGALALLTTTTALAWLARRAVEDRVAELSAAARAKSQLLATISHELRTPLHGILGIASVLGESSLSPEQRELVTALETSGKTLRRTVDDVLDDARLAIGKLSIEPGPVDLIGTLEDVLDLHAADAGRKSLALTLAVEGTGSFVVSADETRVKQIVSNLVANAIKFTPSGSVSVRASARTDGDRSAIEIAVQDTGPGIPADRIERLFTAYDQLDATLSRLHGGTGLGLALARDLAIAMGGTLDAERGRSTGARLVLRVRFPVVTTSPSPSRGGSFLLIEPDAASAAAMRSLAASTSDLELVTVASVDEAERLARSDFDAVLVAQDVEDLAGAHARLSALVGSRARVVLLVARGADLPSSPFTERTLAPLRRSRLRALVGRGWTPSALPRPTRRSALVVDDDGTNRRILVEFLDRLGWTGRGCGSAADALEALDQTTFDAVICDVHMPDVDGVAFVAEARARGHRGHYIAATASVREDERARCLAAGFDTFLRKPFEVSEVAAALARAVPNEPVDARLDPSGLFDTRRWQGARELFGAELAETLDDHEKAVVAQIANIRRHVSEPLAAARAAHAIASGSLMLGLRALGESALEIETHAADFDPPALASRADALADLLERSLLRARADMRAG